MIRSLLYVAGGIGAGIILGFAATTDLLVFVVAGICWAGAAFSFAVVHYRITERGLRPHLRTILQMAAAWPIAALVVLTTETRARLRNRRPRPNRLRECLATARSVALGLYLFLLGFWILSTALPGSKLAALLLGPAFLAAAWLVLQRYQARHNQWAAQAGSDQFIEAGHAKEALVYVLTMVGLAACGILVLYFVL